MVKGLAEPVVALDDDSTGAQALAGIRVLVSWTPARIARALERRRAVHLLTNARALHPQKVARVVASAARAASEGASDAHVVLRGDSTLRGHLREELAGISQALPGASTAPVLLVPAFPQAGRVTLGGIHLLERNGVRVPLHETEYARDGMFSYSDARLLAWADERTGGFLRASAGRELHVDELRRGGPERVAEVIEELGCAGESAAFAPDAETEEDLVLIAEGHLRAHARGARALVHCAPAFVGVLSGTTAPGPVPAPHVANGLLVVCGSYVPTTTSQLHVLLEEHPGSLVEVDVCALAGGSPRREVARAAAEASRILAGDRVAIVSTPRHRPTGTEGLDVGERIAAGLAAVVAAIDPRPSVLVTKGGITSHVVLESGLGADEADVVGPLLPGVSHWRVDVSGDRVDLIVVPGNVGDERLLAQVVRLLQGSPAC